MANEGSIGSPSHAEPILAVSDIRATVKYWHDTLGFPEKWTWGDPPNYGGVAWNGAFIQFNLAPQLAAASKGNAIFIKTSGLEGLYHFHQRKNAKIVEPLENKPWGMAGYTVEDINGYYIIFAGAPITDHRTHSTELPSTVKILARIPTVREYQYLTSSVGWSSFTGNEVVATLLEAPVFAVVAEDEASNHIVGCGLVLSDNASFYYIKDVVVHPDWQSKHVGAAMMTVLTGWIEKNGANKSLIALITGENLSAFYKKFGFRPAFAMIRYLEH
ncbi:MAG TPA: GNAT family N-acetyltransferase [Chitinophagaceae bacterium]|nr:GNAT family N-acetyltransferase [Chitinophagaceae bacterium]